MTMPVPPHPAAAAPRTAVLAGTSATARRLIGAAVAIGAAAILGLAAWLEPSPAGLGTHSQLAMPPCGWIAMVDVPCPTCGMTTAFAHAADGALVAALRAQPVGGILAVAVAMALIVGVYTAVTGSRVAVLFTQLWGKRAAWALGLGVGGAWVYKVLTYKGVLG
ncbi:MAG: DUF2752 domain-containing protein [Planctomycetota bacterium]|jgi:hypothetical protein